MLKLYFILFLFSNNLFAQNSQDSFQKQLDEIMKAREEMLKALMDDSMSGDLEKRMEEMMKRLGSNGDFGFGQMEAPVIGEYDWVEDSTHKILKIKVKQIKDKPLDIKIQNNEIKIKGDVESIIGQGKNKVIRKSSFERTFNIPESVDKINPEFVNGKDGFMEIKFKKYKSSKVTPSKKMDSNLKKDNSSTERVPVNPNGDDLSI